MSSANTNIGLSVLIPIYNTEPYLRQCIDSVANQKTKTHIEIILIDDGSTDASGQIADGYSQADGRISVFHQKNSGVSKTRNKALEMARGEYIVFLDSDDWLMQGSLDMLYNAAKTHRADMAMGNTLFYHSPQRIERRYDTIPPACINIPLSGKQGFIRLMASFSFAPMVYNYIYRRQWLESIQLNFEDIIHEDELWTTMAICQAERIVITPVDFYFYRQREGSIMRGGVSQKTRIDSLLRVAESLTRFSGNYSVENDRELKSWLQVKIYSMYYEAFATLARFQSPSYKPQVVLPDFEADRLWLSPAPMQLCRYHWRRAALKLQEYLWR